MRSASADPPSESNVRRSPVDLRELLVVLAITGAALALRAWALDTVGLAQFDEGVYAFTGLGLSDPSQPHRLFPEQQKFSPPVYFSFVALSFLLGGPSDRNAVLVNVLLGTLSVPLAWWVVRAWFPPGAAVAAATLLAMSEYHVLLSRSALTDVAFAFFFLIAIAALVWSIERGGIWRAVVAGLAVGLAWNTKYHGWFALLIAAGALLGRWWFGPRPRRWPVRATTSLAISGVVGALCYLPWALFIQEQSGSTTGWARYFATMLRLDWLGNFARHAQQQLVLEGPVSRASVPLAALAASIVRPVGTGGGAPSMLSLALLTAGALTLGAAGTAVILSALALRELLRGAAPLAAWFLLALIALWVVAAPVYHPYFRLLLPFTIATFVLSGWYLRELAERDAATGGAAAIRQAATLVAAVAVAAVAVRFPDFTDPWRPSRAFAEAARQISARLPEGATVSAVGEPTLSFYLHLGGNPSFNRTSIESIDSATTEMFIVTGRYTRIAAVLRDMIDRHRSELETLGRFPILPSDLRLLDDNDPRAARAYRANPDSSYDLVLYRYTPRQGAAP